jgi:hypothetical protein
MRDLLDISFFFSLFQGVLRGFNNISSWEDYCTISWWFEGYDRHDGE